MAGVFVETVKELEFKGGQKAISFNVLYGVFDEESYIAVPGFRLIAGCINPPKSLRAGHWYVSCYMSEKLAGAIYEALKLELEFKGLITNHPLNRKEFAVDDLINNSATSKLFPKLIGML